MLTYQRLQFPLSFHITPKNCILILYKLFESLLASSLNLVCITKGDLEFNYPQSNYPRVNYDMLV